MRRAIQRRVREAVYNRDAFLCSYCPDPNPSHPLCVDHIVPVIDGGPDRIWNLATACVDCNSRKGCRWIVPLDDTLMRLIQPQVPASMHIRLAASFGVDVLAYGRANMLAACAILSADGQFYEYFDDFDDALNGYMVNLPNFRSKREGLPW